MILVRKAEIDDSQAIVEITRLGTKILREIYLEKENQPREKVSGLIPLVAITKDRIVGTVKYKNDPERIRIIGLFTHPDFLRVGVARSLINEIVKIGDQLGVHSLSLHTIKETGNVMVFEKLGFKTIVEKVDEGLISPKYPFLTDVQMEKTL